MTSLCRKEAFRMCFYHTSTHSYLSTLSHTHPTPSHTHPTPSHTHPTPTYTSHTSLKSYKTTLSRVSPYLQHYHPIHTHTPSHTLPTPSHTHPTPFHTPATSLPASYTSLGSVYVHWPYCKQRCSYCNFVKFIPRADTHWTLPHDVLEDAIVQELEHTLSRSHITHVPSVFLGGGTPSLARPHLVEKVLRSLQDKGHLMEGAEVTLEVNPTSLETQALRDFKEAGVNRVSIGVQSLDTATLKLLNRDHSVKEAKSCLEATQSLFPGRTSVDLMFGVPNHTVERWEREVQEIVSLCNSHLSLYQLTVERGTALYRQVMAGDVKLPDQDQMADLYTVAGQVLQEAGLHRYEVSNFAHHQSAESIHNKGYWQGQQYIGVGPGAHSRVVPQVWEGAMDSVRNGGTVKGTSEVAIPTSVGDSNSGHGRNTVPPHSAVHKNNTNTSCSAQALGTEYKTGEDRSCTTSMAHQVIREARVNAADPASWLQETLKKGDGTRKTECQTRVVAAAEYLASGLRTREGVTAPQWSVFLPHTPLREVFGGELGWLRDAGLVQLTPEGLRVTEEGLAVLDAFLPHLYNILHHHLE